MDFETLFVSTLGFTPSIVFSDNILKFIAENRIPQPFRLLILYPQRDLYSNKLISAIKELKDQFENYQNLNIIRSELSFQSILVDNFEEAVLKIMDIVFENMNFLEKNYEFTHGYQLNLFFNLSGGMNSLIIAAYTVALYFPSKLIFTFIENTTQIVKIQPPNLIHKLTKTDYRILKEISYNKIGLKLNEITENFNQFGIKKDRSTIFRHIKELIKLNLLIEYREGKKSVHFQITNHGLFIIKASDLFPFHYFYH